MKHAVVMRSLLVSVALGALVGCEGKFSTTTQLGTTRRVTSTADQTRVWAVSEEGLLRTYTAAGNATSAWQTIGKPTASPLAPEGVATLFSEEGGAMIESAYVADSAGALHRSTITNDGPPSWATSPLPYAFAGPVAVAKPFSANPVVGAIADGMIALMDANMAFSFGLRGVPEGFATDTRLVSATMGLQSCFFARTANGKLARVADGDMTPGAMDVSMRRPLAAVSWAQAAHPRASVFVLSPSGLVSEVTFTVDGPRAADCGGTPTLTPLEKPPGVTLANETHAFGVVAYEGVASAWTHTSYRELVVADTLGNLWSRSYSGATEAWAPKWVKRPRATDAIGAVGSVHVTEPRASDPSSAEPRTFFVGNVTAAPIVNAGYLHEVTANYKVQSHVDAVDGARIVNACSGADCTSSPWKARAWTEAMMHARPGRASLAAMIIGDLTGPDAQRIGFGTSIDDGGTWTLSLLPKLLLDGPGTFAVQGDPTVQVDASGTTWVMWHEIQRSTCSAEGAQTGRSLIRIASSENGTTFTFHAPDAAWDYVNPTPPAPNYLDHPQLGIDGQGVHHYAWLTERGVAQSTDERRVWYRTGTGASLGAPLEVPDVDSDHAGPPYLVPDAGAGAHLAWASDQARAMYWRPGQSPVDLTALSGACVLHGYPAFDGPSPLLFRTGEIALAASPTSPGHVAVAWLVASGTDIIGPKSCKPATDPPTQDVIVAERASDTSPWTFSVITAGAPAAVRVLPGLAIDAREALVATYWQRDSGYVASQRRAVRTPESPEWSIVSPSGTPGGGANLDISDLPPRCGQPSNSKFAGDYHIAQGGQQTLHGLRVESLNDGPRLVSSAISSTSVLQ